MFTFRMSHYVASTMSGSVKTSHGTEAGTDVVWEDSGRTSKRTTCQQR